MNKYQKEIQRMVKIDLNFGISSIKKYSMRYSRINLRKQIKKRHMDIKTIQSFNNIMENETFINTNECLKELRNKQIK